ncbi:TetR/AcrR family transcriptional regulator [Streptomyces sp. NPDC051940]|uniref:TetR/AcrR family transcriptional regulator n=1 Tax=Streptomyces sp. NPDC051940 TaxID=3155675 RepID=UPI003418226C
MASDRRKARDSGSSVWLSGPPARHASGGQPHGLGLDKIVEATVRLLDAEGLAKVSMRRLAGELGVTAMSVYWYVDTKDELLELALDHVHEEIRLPADDVDWRERLRQLAREHRRMLVTHPWVSPLAGEYLNIGPRALAFAECAQEAIRDSGLPARSWLGALSLLFQFSYGFGTVEGRWRERCRSLGVSEDELHGEVMARLAGRSEYAVSLATVQARGEGAVGVLRERDFEFALDCAIAGITEMGRSGTGSVGGR